MPNRLSPLSIFRFVPKSSLALTFALAAVAFCSANALAQRSGKGPAFTSPPADDPNYALLGEFAGAIKTGENQYEPLALQIRPIGRDQFEAISFWGGLPGQEKHKPEMTKMIGVRSGDYVVLSGGPWAIFVEKDHCLIVDRKGDKLGHLDRVERQSPTLGAAPPKGAMVLFDGTNLDQFVGARMTDDGLLMEGAEIRPMLQDFNMHVEFRLPYMPEANGQSRGNSGLYLQSRYECQVLDSFATEPLFDGCGALYRFKAPDLNMCFPPLVWQTYDIQFTAPRWASDGSKIRGAHITSWINGVKVQDNVSLPNKTGAGKEEAPLLLPIHIQNHGDPVRFRNIWVIDRGLTTVEFPVTKKDDPKPGSPEKKSTEKQSAEKQKPSAASDKEDKKPEAKQEKPAEAKKDKAEAKPAETKPAAEKTSAPAKNDKPADEKAEAASK